jgi:hypothetical protein
MKNDAILVITLFIQIGSCWMEFISKVPPTHQIQVGTILNISTHNKIIKFGERHGKMKKKIKCSWKRVCALQGRSQTV